MHNYIQPKSMCIKEKKNARGGVTRRSGALFGTGGDTHGYKGFFITNGISSYDL